MQTSENQQALGKILDMSRMIAILIVHFYYQCYTAFAGWTLVSAFSDRLLDNIIRTGLFSYFNKPKLIALCFLTLSLMGVKGKKKEDLSVKTGMIYIGLGLAIYFLSYFILKASMDIGVLAVLYIGVSCLGFALIISGGTLLSRVIALKINSKDIFNKKMKLFRRSNGYCRMNTRSICLPATGSKTNTTATGSTSSTLSGLRLWPALRALVNPIL